MFEHGAKTERLTWLGGLCSHLRQKPDVTVYVSAPLAVRRQRIQSRTRPFIEARSSAVSAEDVEVFEARERIARRLVREEPYRFLIVDNGHRPLDEGAADVVGMVLAGLQAHEGGR